MQEGPRNPARDEAFRKLGRNIALFQQLEGLLKHLVAGSTVEGGTQEQIEIFIRCRNALAAKSTLGIMAGRFVDEVLGRKEPSVEEEKKTMFMRTRFQVEGVEYMKQREASLAGLVEERNQLVHNLLQNFDLWNPEGVQKLDDLLDPQADRIRDEIEELKRIAIERQEMASSMAEYIESISDELLTKWFGAEQRSDGWPG